ncbi:hypothetical protein OESDEN_23047 [Oesophagostomum dentatum]|uniref:Uncharacterized protein n=1 Tax=Oesophagostomum dentatum TaxID=61180 RepID=A0A0B1RW84_OESDE|nr:hypothetical protein OESDEN_23047 [Oesophagostomum dentatum]
MTLKRSPLWKFFTHFVLDKNMLLRNGEESHAQWLRAIGEGKNFMNDGVHVGLPSCICLPNEKSVIEWVYSSEILKDSVKMSRVTLLTVRNADAIELNELALQKLPGDVICLYGIDTPASEEEGAIGMPCDDEEYLHKHTPSGMPKYNLSLVKVQ